jgi:hypothetical protein
MCLNGGTFIEKGFEVWSTHRQKEDCTTEKELYLSKHISMGTGGLLGVNLDVRDNKKQEHKKMACEEAMS